MVATEKINTGDIMKLHFYSNETMLYKDLGMGAMWKYLKQWRDIAPELGHEIIIGPSPRVETTSKYREECVGHDHPIPDRHRTILEVNNKLIYFDQQDYPGIGAKLEEVPDLFDLAIKFQYRENNYKKIPFKVVPFTYFTPSDNKMVVSHRKQREEVLQSRKFKYSIMWAGSTGKTGLHVRKAINYRLRTYAKQSIHGRFGIEDYYNHICNSMAGAAARGIGDFCHRDIEFMAIGTPFLRKHFRNQTRDPLIPNVHYYSIGGDEVGIDKTMDHYISYFEHDGEIAQMSNEERDKYCEIIKNGMEWYERNADPKASLKLLITVLEENNMI